MVEEAGELLEAHTLSSLSSKTKALIMVGLCVCVSGGGGVLLEAHTLSSLSSKTKALIMVGLCVCQGGEVRGGLEAHILRVSDASAVRPRRSLWWGAMCGKGEGGTYQRGLP